MRVVQTTSPFVEGQVVQLVLTKYEWMQLRYGFVAQRFPGGMLMLGVGGQFDHPEADLEHTARCLVGEEKCH